MTAATSTISSWTAGWRVETSTALCVVVQGGLAALGVLAAGLGIVGAAVVAACTVVAVTFLAVSAGFLGAPS